VILAPLRALLSCEPTERTLALLAGVFALGVVSMGVPALGDAVALALVLVVVALVVDAVFAGDPGAIAVAREAPAVWRQGASTEIALAFTTAGACRIDVTDSLPDDATPRTTEIGIACAPGTTTTRYSARATRRGAHAFGRVALRTTGPLGLVRRRARHVVATPFTVEPDLAAIARASAMERGLSATDGAARRVRAEDGRELDALRDYARGDDVRLIEWKASAKRRALVVRAMRPESRQDLVLLVDAGRQLMGTLDEEDGGAPRIDAAVTSALVTGASALAFGDRVTALSFAEDVTSMRASRGGPGALKAIADAYVDVEARPAAPDYARVASFVVDRHPRRALVAIFTDVTDEHAARALVTGVARLARRHLPVVVAISDPAWARIKEHAQDPAVRLAAERTLLHRRRALAALTRAGALVVDADAASAVAKAHAAYVRVKRDGRL